MSFFEALLGAGGIPFLQGITNVVALGDSITVGQNANVPFTTNGYIYQYKTTKGFTINNIAVGGRGVWRMIQDSKALAYTRLSTLMTAMIGLNDMVRAGNNAKTIKKVQAGHHFYAYKHFAKSTIASGNTGVTRSGTFSSFASGLAIGFTKTNGTLPGNFNSFTTNNGDYWEYTFTENNVGVIMGGLDGVTYTGWGTADIYIDSVLVYSYNAVGWYDAITDNSYDNGRGPVPLFFPNLGSGSHTIKVVNTSTSATVVDQFYHLDSPSNLGPLLFLEIPYKTAAGYAAAPANGSQAISDIYSQEILTIANYYLALGYRVKYFPTNTYLNLSTMMDADGTHWNQLGHTTIASQLVTFTG